MRIGRNKSISLRQSDIVRLFIFLTNITPIALGVTPNAARNETHIMGAGFHPVIYTGGSDQSTKLKLHVHSPAILGTICLFTVSLKNVPADHFLAGAIQLVENSQEVSVVRVGMKLDSKFQKLTNGLFEHIVVKIPHLLHRSTI
jgi:hypothetical protein